MATDFVPQSPIEAPEKIAADLAGAVSKLTEAAREARLQSGSKSINCAGPQSSPYQFPEQFPAPYYGHSETNQGYNNGGFYSPSANDLREELQAQLDAANGTSIRHRRAAGEDLDDVVSKVNSGALEDGLKLGAIDSPSKLHILNPKGGEDHSNLTIDLATGVISDQSDTRYVAKEDRGRISFTPAEPVTVKSSDNIRATYDAKEQLTKLVLADGTTLSKDVTTLSRYGPPTFTVTDGSGNPLGTAQNVNYDGTTVIYKTDNGQSLVAIDGNRMVKENLLTGDFRSKIASEPGFALPSSDLDQQAKDAEILTRGAASIGVPITQPRLSLPIPKRSDLLKI